MKWIRRIATTKRSDIVNGKLYPVLKESEVSWLITNDEGEAVEPVKGVGIWEEVSSSTNKEGEP